MKTATPATHTPGPWETAIVDQGDLKQAATIVAATVKFGRQQYQVVEPGGIWGRTIGEADANARLIASSPYLLDALMQAVDESGWSVSGPTDHRAAENGEPPWVCNARDAIASATR